MTSRYIPVILTLAVISMQTDCLQIAIRPQGAVHTKALDSSMVLSCQQTDGAASEGDDVTVGGVNFKWLDSHMREVTSRSGRLYVEPMEEGLKLYITMIEATDTGLYTCQASHLNGTVVERSTRLDIYEGIAFVNFTSHQHPRIHTNGIIHCLVTGVPAPTVSWMHNGRRIATRGRYLKVTQGLMISNVTQADDGVYRCRAEVDDDGRYDQRNINVTVYIPPTITVRLSEWTETVEGQNVSLHCKATGLPSPTYEFYKDGALIAGSGGSVVVDAVEGRLDLLPALKDDAGFYQCRALNDIGDDSGTGFLKVLVPPLVYELTANVTLAETDSLELSCRSRGDYPPVMSFIKDDKIYSLDDQDEEGRVVVSSAQPDGLTLRIGAVRVSDAGLYVCVSTNRLGTDQRISMVVVNYKPRFAPDDALLVLGWADTKRNLTCRVHGQPAPSIEWQRVGVALQNNDTFQTYRVESGVDNATSSLEVSVKAEDEPWIFAEKYICLATNSLGAERQKFELRQAVRPSAPSGLVVVENLADSLVLEVGAPQLDGGLPLISYALEYSEALALQSETEPRLPTASMDEGASTVANVSNGTVMLLDGSRLGDNDRKAAAAEAAEALTIRSMIVFEGNRTRLHLLKPDTSYALRVHARNQVGLGPALERTVMTAKCSVPGVAIIKSSNVSSDPLKYTLTWELVNTGGRPIIAYQLNYTRVSVDSPGSEQGDWHTVCVTSAEVANGQFVMEGLQPLSDYSVRLRARNDIGWSQPTAEFAFQTIEDPDAVRKRDTYYLNVGLSVVYVLFGVFALLLVFDVYRYVVHRAGLIERICRHNGRNSLNRSGDKSLEAAENTRPVKSAEMEDVSSISTDSKLRDSPINGGSSDTVELTQKSPN